MAQPQLRVLDLGLQRLTDIMLSLQKPKFRAKQIWEAALLQDKRTFDAITTLSLKDRETLRSQFVLRESEVDAESISQDGTVKWLLRCRRLQMKDRLSFDNDQSKDHVGHILPTKPQVSESAMRMEAVFIPEPASGARAGRGTLCVSSQAGCSLACSFCHTGTQALHGNASSGDILEQVLVARQRVGELQQRPEHKNMPHLTNIVFMGQGEPLLNWSNVKRAIGVLTSPVPSGLGMAPRRVTISTSGVAPLIPKIATETPGVRLALSLHAPTDELRSRIMGINKTWPLAEVMSGCRSYLLHRLRAVSLSSPSSSMSAEDELEEEEEDAAELTDAEWLMQKPSTAAAAPARSRGGSVGSRFNSGRRVRITFEYVMLEGINDAHAHALQLVQLLRRELNDESVAATPVVAQPGLSVEAVDAPSLRENSPPALARPAGSRLGIKVEPSLSMLSPTVHAHVNLIPFNPWPGSEYSCSSVEAIRSFQAVLLSAGISCTVRRSRGQDVMGACGQLRSSEEKKRSPKI